MPRLNIYLPEMLAHELRAYRDEINVSEVCAAALRAEISARMTARNAAGLPFVVLRAPSTIEEALTHRFRLRLANVSGANSDTDDPMDTVARSAAEFLDGAIYEGLHIGVGGGTQMWSALRRLPARNVGLSVSAIGFGHVDRVVPHVHPNVLVTLLSLLYAPRSTAALVGAPDFKSRWSLEGTAGRDVRRIIIGSCARFDAESAHSRLLGDEITDLLDENHVVGDFLGVFLTADGRQVEPYVPTSTVSHLGSADLREHARRPDTIVALAAAGEAKIETMRRVLEAELCNMLITDERTARSLLSRRPATSL